MYSSNLVKLEDFYYVLGLSLYFNSRSVSGPIGKRVVHFGGHKHSIHNYSFDSHKLRAITPEDHSSQGPKKSGADAGFDNGLKNQP